MAWNFYLDESGHDGKTTPLVVVGGFGVKAAKQTALIEDVKELYKECFGVSYDMSHELKGAYLLHKKKFKWADNYKKLDNDTRQFHAARFLSKSENAAAKSKMDFCGYGQACLLFVARLFKLLNQYECYIYATCAAKDFLNKHEAGTQNFVKTLENELVLNIRYFLEIDKSRGSIYFDKSESSSDLIKIDELIKLNSTSGYQIKFDTLDSENSLEIQIADICIYCINWGLNEYQKTGYTYSEINETKVGQLLQILNLSWVSLYENGAINKII